MLIMLKGCFNQIHLITFDFDSNLLRFGFTLFYTMSFKNYFPFIQIIRSVFFSESKPFIEKELRNEMLKMDDESFIKTIEELKKGQKVKIGKKQYSSHNSKIVMND